LASRKRPDERDKRLYLSRRYVQVRTRCADFIDVLVHVRYDDYVIYYINGTGESSLIVSRAGRSFRIEVETCPA